MPDLDGFELMAQLKARFPAIDVILMTGSVDDLDEKLIRAIRSPAFYFIQKPFDREVLRTLVERCVELRWRREEHRQNLQAARNRDGRSARLSAESAAAARGVAESCGDLLAATRRARSSAAISTTTPTRTADAPRLLIADVSGHGVSAAMLTGIVKSAFHASHVDHNSCGPTE